MLSSTMEDQLDSSDSSKNSSSLTSSSSSDKPKKSKKERKNGAKRPRSLAPIDPALPDVTQTSSESTDPKDAVVEIKSEQKKWRWDARFPAQMMPMVVGPVGLGLSWKRMSVLFDNNHTLEVVSLVILGITVSQMVLLMALLLWKAFRYRHISWLEHLHPTHFLFATFIPLYFCLLSSFIIKWSETTARVFWYIGAGGLFLFMVYAAHRHLVQPIPIAQMNSFYLFGPLPILLAIQLAPFAPSDLLICGWSIGTIWYAGLMTILAFRWIHVGLPPKRERPAMWLIVAATADSLLGWAAAKKEFDDLAKVLFFFCIFQVAVLLTMTPRLFQGGFSGIWWMTTLPASAHATSWMAYGVAIKNVGVQYVGVVCCGMTTLWVLVLYCLTWAYIIKKDLLPKTPYKPPVDKTPLQGYPSP